MLLKKGDVYRNKENNVAVYIRDIKGNNPSDKVTVAWSYKSLDVVRPLHHWEEVIHGPNGYIEYRITKRVAHLLQELETNYLTLVEQKADNKLIMSWIPHYSFLAT